MAEPPDPAGDRGAPDDDAVRDAADIVRLAFQQAERVTRQAEAERDEARRLLEEARAEAERLVATASSERENLLADARRERVHAEELLLRARTEAEREADEVLARASELARREAEILLEGGRMELLRARDEASAIRSAAQRDAEAIVASATQRARSTSADLLAATRRRLGDSIAGNGSPGAANGEPNWRSSAPAPPGEVVDVTDDHPPPDWTAQLDEPGDEVGADGGSWSPESADWASRPHRVRREAVALAARQYRGDSPRQPGDEDIELLVHDAVGRAVRAAFRRRRRRSQSK